MIQKVLLDKLHSIAEIAGQDARLMHRGRFLNARMRISIDDENHLLHINDGKPTISPITLKPFQDTELSIKGSSKAWAALWERYPQPGWHDLFALCKRGEMKIEGDLHLFFSHLQYIKDVLNYPRRTASE